MYNCDLYSLGLELPDLPYSRVSLLPSPTSPLQIKWLEGEINHPNERGTHKISAICLCGFNMTWKWIRHNVGLGKMIWSLGKPECHPDISTSLLDHTGDKKTKVIRNNNNIAKLEGGKHWIDNLEGLAEDPQEVRAGIRDKASLEKNKWIRMFS